MLQDILRNFWQPLPWRIAPCHCQGQVHIACYVIVTDKRFEPSGLELNAIL